MLSTHYRKPMDWTKKKGVEAEAALKSFAEKIVDVPAGPVDASVVDALSNDLNTSLAITRMRQLAKNGDTASLRGTLDFLGIDLSRQIKAVRDAIRPQAPSRMSSYKKTLKDRNNDF